MTKQYFHNQEVLFLTEKWGKPYFFMKDGDGTVYMVPARERLTGWSVDGETGKRTPVFSEELEPDFGFPDFPPL